MGRLEGKVAIVTGAASGIGKACAEHLAREGAQREGGKGRGFDAEKGGIDLTATLRGWQQAGDARLWKFIVSPEHGERLDLKAHARALVSHLSEGEDRALHRPIGQELARDFTSSLAPDLANAFMHRPFLALLDD